MDKNEILESAEICSKKFGADQKMAKSAFIEGALWAMKKTRLMLINLSLGVEGYEEEV